MSEQNEIETIRTTVEISPAKSMNPKDWQDFGLNLIKFVAPTLAVFFGQLAVGVHWKVAGFVALLAFYQALSDFFGKYNYDKIRPAEGSDLAKK